MFRTLFKIHLNSKENDKSPDGSKGHLELSIPNLISEEKNELYVTMTSCRIPYTHYNISTTLNTDSFRYTLDGVTWFVINIDNGILDGSGITSMIKYYLKLNNHYESGSTPAEDIYPFNFSFSNATGKSWFYANDITNSIPTNFLSTNYQIDLTNSGTSLLGDVLGFTVAPENIVFTGDKTYTFSDSRLNLLGDWAEVYISCSLVDSIEPDGSSNNIIYSTGFLSQPNGAFRVKSDDNLVLKHKSFKKVTVKFENLYGELFKFNGDEGDNYISIVLAIKEAV